MKDCNQGGSIYQAEGKDPWGVYVGREGHFQIQGDIWEESGQ